ncbi:MAG: hypothetical protein ABSC53_03390 [Bacteroidota bacterium]
MFKNTNIKQIFVLLFFGSLSVIILYGLLTHPENLNMNGNIVAIVLFLYFSIRLLFITGNMKDDKVIFKTHVQPLIEERICPFCKSNHFVNETTKVGYRKPHLYIAYKIFWIEWRRTVDELSVWLPICEECRRRYFMFFKIKLFKRFGLDPSYRVLKIKQGCFRGIRYPLEEWNFKESNQ